MARLLMHNSPKPFIIQEREKMKTYCNFLFLKMTLSLPYFPVKELQVHLSWAKSLSVIYHRIVNWEKKTTIQTSREFKVHL